MSEPQPKKKKSFEKSTACKNVRSRLKPFSKAIRDVEAELAKTEEGDVKLAFEAVLTMLKSTKAKAIDEARKKYYGTP